MMNGFGAMRERDEYSISELQALTGLSGRTVRYYVSEGLLPAAHGRGPSATYGREHVLRLNLIQRLKAERLPLETIKQRLDGLSDRQIASLVESEARPAGEAWRRIEIHPDIELHVRSKPMPEGHELEETVQLILETIQPTLDRLKRSGIRLRPTDSWND
jgi:DNA-binding transcriptional MerR regulator